jgi:NAD(P)-dependent dehydrogenase (short-subunit alcohol dehydrogenase family)
MTTPSLTGRNCLITGATGGLGGPLARAFWSAGACVALTGRDAAQLDRLRGELALSAQGGQKVVAIAADLAGGGAVQLVDRVEAQLGGLTVLVNNAAMQGPIGPAWENDLPQWERTIRTNLVAPFELCAAVLPGMLQRGRGKIINISGGGATSSRPHFSAYAASKAALVRLTEVLADETRGRGVDVNAIAPGAMNTRMTAEVVSAGAAKAGQDEYQRACKQAQSGGASPERAAALAVFLASAQSDGITGRLISALWDPWEELPGHLDEIRTSDIYTLRRIVPSDRGKDWGTK